MKSTKLKALALFQIVQSCVWCEKYSKAKTNNTLEKEVEKLLGELVL